MLLQHDFDFPRPILLYKDDELVDLFVIDTSTQTIQVPLNEDEKQLGQDVVDAEEAWATTHSYERVLQCLYLLRSCFNELLHIAVLDP